jgi:hypothetical protein
VNGMTQEPYLSGQINMKHVNLFEDFATDNPDLERSRQFTGSIEDLHSWMSRKAKETGHSGETNPYKDTIMVNGPHKGQKDISLPYQDFQNGKSDLIKNRHGRQDS